MLKGIRIPLRIQYGKGINFALFTFGEFSMERELILLCLHLVYVMFCVLVTLIYYSNMRGEKGCGHGLLHYV